MKFLILVFISIPVFACKMTPEGGARKARATVLKAVKAKTGLKEKNLQARKVNGGWIVRTKRPSCREFKMNLVGGKGDCKMTARIISEKACP